MAAIVNSFIVNSFLARSRSNTRGLALAALAAAVLALAGCAKLAGGGGNDEMNWARAALARNPHIDIVAVDPDARTFTVRIKGTDELRVVPLEEIVAGPMIGTAGPAAGSASAGPAAAPTPPAAQPAGVPATAPATPASTPAPDRSAGPTSVASGSPSDEAAAAPAGDAPGDAKGGPPGDAKGGRVLAAGPGYSIKASNTPGVVTKSAAGPELAAGALERRHEPIICQGARLLHIDNRNLQFDGDAVSAEDGCELHITNSRITAKGIGVLARAANVHIKNSEIEGDSGAIDASDGAQVYAESSTFKGLSRHLDSSAFHDLGGNAWN